MPCNIGYRSYSRVRIPTPKPQRFRKKAEAPKIDADLLDRLGIDDPSFLDWLEKLDIVPLLQEALKRALQAVPADGIRFVVSATGDLIATAQITSPAAQSRAERLSGLVMSRWQMEVLAVVAQILDFETVITAASGGLTLEGERPGESDVHEYLRVTSTTSETSLRFEHFKSPRDLARLQDKFLALAQKLGVRIRVLKTESGGQPIAEGAIHRDFLKH